MIHGIAALHAIRAERRCLIMAERRTSVSQRLRRSIPIAPRARRVREETMESDALDVAPSMAGLLRAGAPRVPLSLTQVLTVARCGIHALQA